MPESEPDSDFIADVRVDQDGTIRVEEMDSYFEVDCEGDTMKMRKVRVGEGGVNEYGPWELVDDG